MGICSSSYSKEKRENNIWSNTSLDVEVKKTLSDDFSSFINKFSGGAPAAAERALQPNSGRWFANGATRVTSLYTQQGRKGINQDAMIVWENFSSRSNTIFCGVFDGHGPHGHWVARKVRDTLPLLLRTAWEATSVGDHECAIENGDAAGSWHLDSEEFLDVDFGESGERDDDEKFPEMHLPIKDSILKAFKLMDRELKNNPGIDCFSSGSTAVTMVIQDQDILIGNVGDSRAILATRDKDNSLMAVQLTVDLKPNLPREAARIQKCKGRVFALQDEPEVARVWLPDSNSPGLAMARAFGDFCLKDFGLISVPDVYYHHITERDEFVVLATDGVWDVLSNKEAVDIVASAPGRASAARALVDCATRSWRLKYPTSKMDDCTVLCLFLEPTFAADKVSKTTTNDTECAKSVTSSRASEIEVVASQASALENGDSTKDFSEIVPVVETVSDIIPEKSSVGQSKRSLAECLSTPQDDEWTALEGITRVNSFLSIPRFLSLDKRSAGWRKWL